MDDRRHRDTQPGQQCQHRFDEQRHVVGDDLYGDTHAVGAAHTDDSGVRCAPTTETDVLERGRAVVGGELSGALIDPLEDRLGRGIAAC